MISPGNALTLQIWFRITRFTWKNSKNSVPMCSFAQLWQNRDFSECIDRAYNWANEELIKIVIQEQDLIGRLKSMKKYFFLQAGDFLVHFLDACSDELEKKINQIS